MNPKAQSEAPSVDDTLNDLAIASYYRGKGNTRINLEDEVQVATAKINRLIERSREELLNSIKQDLPKGEVNSMYHDLYSGHSKEWTQGFRTGYDICRNSTIATLEKVATPPVVSNNLSKEQLGEK